MIPVPYFSSCADKGYDFSIGKFDKFVFVGRPMIAYVNGGVPPYTWSQQGNEFDIANLVTSSQFNRIVTNDKTVVGESADKITVVDSCSHRISFVIKCCSTYLCCDQQTIVFSVDAVEQQPVSDSVLKVYGGCPPFRWESQDPRAQFITEWTEVRQNILMYDDLSENLSYLRYQVTDHCGNVAANTVYFYIFEEPMFVTGGGYGLCWYDDGSAMGLFFRSEFWDSRIDVSADGGHTWTTVTGTGRSGLDYNIHLACINGIIFIGGNGVTISTDGGNTWTTTTANPNSTIEYNPSQGLYVNCHAPTGYRESVFTSPDGVTWTQQGTLGVYSTYPLNTYFKGKHYFSAGNRDNMWESVDCITWIPYSGTDNPYLILPTSSRGAGVVAGSYLYTTYAKFSGTLWSAWEYPLTFAQFKSPNYLLITGEYAVRIVSIFDNTEKFYLSTLTNSYGIRSQVMYQCCWGKDRWMAIGQYETIFGKFG